MTYPSGSDYVEALQNPQISFKEQNLRESVPQLDKLGRPRPISGNFASVFSLTAMDGKRYAIKCFTKPVQDQEVRYRAISEHLAQVESPWKVGFEYKHDGVLIRNDWYPILKMDWIDGTSLNAWIDRNISHPSAIFELAQSFATLVRDLNEEGIAHGDLQHGNLLVASNGSLRLVDYDGMFVPALAGMYASERGHRNYQSPLRSSEFHPGVDRFSAWVIYLSLVALAQQPSLWTQLREPHGEHLLLTEEDFKNPAASARFPALLNNSAPETRSLAQKVLDLTAVPTAAIPELEPVELSPRVTNAGAATSTALPHHGGQAGHPAWMTGHLEPTKTEDPIHFNGRSRLNSLVAVGVFPLALLLVVAVAVGVTPPAAASLGGAAAAVIWIMIIGSFYWARPETSASRQARKQLAQVAELNKEAQRESQKVRDEMVRLDKSESKRNASEQQQRDSIQKRQRDDTGQVDRRLQKLLARAATDRAGVLRKRQQELDRALEFIQSSHVRAQLDVIRVSSAKIEGFGQKMFANLRDVGIATAADFTGVRYQTSSQSTIALFVLSSGREVRVPGVGEVKAKRLDAWRQSQVRVAQRSLPKSIPEPTRLIIFGKYSALEKDIETSERQARVDAQTKRIELGQRMSRELIQFADRQRQANVAGAQQRNELVQRRAAADVKNADIGPRVRRAEADTRACSEITFIQFVGFLMKRQHVSA
jgi:Protein kinase domain